MNNPEALWTKEEQNFINQLDTPLKIQDYIDSIPYNATHETNSPRWVMRKKRAHCVEGALFAAACLQNIGFRPLVLDMRAVNDDDHVIAVYKQADCWGAIAKSNFTVIRLREPVYRSIRELVMSYFDFYFNSIGEKTLRAYSLPLDLRKFDKQNWQTTDQDLEFISTYLDSMRHHPIISSNQADKLMKVSPSLLKAGMMGSNPEGLFKPTID
ncbi:MAG: hypothetical protein R2750_10900 [Bacteroidales bacterium]